MDVTATAAAKDAFERAHKERSAALFAVFSLFRLRRAPRTAACAA